VFNALGNAYRDPKHAFRLYQSVENPLGVCRNRKEPYGETCYIDISLAHIEKQKLPFQEAIAFLGAIPHKEGAEYAVFGYVDNEIRREIKEFDARKWGHICATMPSRFIQSCIKGVVVGLLIWKSPDPVLHFCSLPETENNSDYCRKEFFGRLSALYSSEEKTKICATIPPIFQSYCK
jgi:hypothetical protein